MVKRPVLSPDGGAMPMSATAPSVGLGAGADDGTTLMKGPAEMDLPEAGAPRTLARSPFHTLRAPMPMDYRGQASDLRRFTRRQQRRAGRALTR